MSDFPMVRFGSADDAPNDIQGEDSDPDDEEISTPLDIVSMLGFDPAGDAAKGADAPDLDLVLQVVATLAETVQ